MGRADAPPTILINGGFPLRSYPPYDALVERRVGRAVETHHYGGFPLRSYPPYDALVERRVGRAVAKPTIMVGFHFVPTHPTTL
ncbi:MAG: hypothetical protein KAI83_06895 [Thiomargarita sp.]|nr:hypothetical protein [Thiomargarita sp.]